MKAKIATVWTLSVGVWCGASPALAQSDVRGQGVADRAHPEYDPYGIDVGSFKLLPAVRASAEATDNYLASNTNRRSDVYLTVEPEVQVRSNWSRHRLTGRAYVNQSLHASLPDENVRQYGANVTGILDVTRQTQLRGDISSGQFVESRSSLGAFRASVEPVRYSILSSSVGASHAFNRLVVSAAVDANRVNFRDVRSSTGTLFDQDFRDVRTARVSGSAKYEMGSGIGLIVSGSVDDSRYGFRPGKLGFNPLVNIDRTSSGYSVLGGVTLELSSLIFGSVQVGLLDRKYRDPRLRNFRGLSYNANILWNVTPLTSIRLRADRSVEDTSSFTVAGNVRSTFQAGVDHELYRNIILTGDTSYSSFRPNGPGAGGKEFAIAASARYLINRRWSAGARIGYSQRLSDATFLKYRATTGSLSLRYAF